MANALSNNRTKVFLKRHSKEIDMNKHSDGEVSIKLEDHLQQPESVGDIPNLRIFFGDDEDVEDAEILNRQEHVDREKVEEFWAGRNHAMRRSARSAA